MTWEERIRRHREDILRLADKHGARNVRVFGSVARGEADEQSDLDLLVDFEPGRSLLDHGGLWIELNDLLGCKVDVVSDRAASNLGFASGCCRRPSRYEGSARAPERLEGVLDAVRQTGTTSTRAS